MANHLADLGSQYPSLSCAINLYDSRHLLAYLPHPVDPVPPDLSRRQGKPLALKYDYGQIPREHWRVCLAQHVQHSAHHLSPPE